MAHDVFISYAAEDKPTADAVCAALEGKRVRCWIAPRDVLPGVSYAEALIEAINASRVMVLVFSSRSNNSPHVMREVERAVNKGIPIMPLRIEDVPLSPSMEYFISTPHWLDALTPPLEEHLGHLAETVNLVLSRTAAPEPLRSEPEVGKRASAIMEPRIQYAKTSDGVSIAFSTIGDGAPLVYMSNGLSHCRLEWDIPECRRWYEALAGRHELVRFDFRGLGLSDRDVSVSAFAMEDFQQDLDAVVDRLGLGTFALFAQMHSALLAVAYAARYPERVSRLILWCGYATASEWTKSPLIQASRSLVDKDWVFFTETFAHFSLGWSEGEPARRYAALMRASITREFLQAFYAAMVNWDMAPLLPNVSAPTLVLQRNDAIPGVQVAGHLAARIPDARLVILAGESTAPYLGDSGSALAAIDEFLSEGEAPPELPSAREG